MLEITAVVFKRRKYILPMNLSVVFGSCGKKYECCLFCLLSMMVLKCSIPQVIVGAELRVSA